jgi:hypothetical protein
MKKIIGLLVLLATVMVNSAVYATVHNIETKTCNQKDADNDDSFIYLSIYGSAGEVNEFHLNNKDRDDFERGATDSFLLSTLTLGEIDSIMVALYGTDGWGFNWIAITDTAHKEVWTFTYNSFIDGNSEYPPRVSCFLESAHHGACSASH